MKKFLDYKQQLSLLKSRGLGISDDNNAINILVEYGYYNLVNGYKDIFLSSRKTETYIPDTKMSDMVALYSFDKKLRNGILNNILGIETFIKAIIAHELASIGECSYLDSTTYETRTSAQSNKVSKLIIYFKGMIKTKASISQNAISHYSNKYNSVPIWVAINFFTLGNVSLMYSLLPNATKITIVQAINKAKNLSLSTAEFANYLAILTFARNECAHNQRIYNFSCRPTLSSKHPVVIKLASMGIVPNLGLEKVVVIFHDFLTHDEFEHFIKYLLQEVGGLYDVFSLTVMSNFLSTFTMETKFLNAVVDKLI